MKKWIWTAVGLLTLGTANAASDNLAVGKNSKVLKGDEGVVVAVVPLASTEEPKALLKISGIDHPWDGEVMLYTVRKAGEDTDFVTPFDGREWATLISRPSHGGSPYS